MKSIFKTFLKISLTQFSLHGEVFPSEFNSHMKNLLSSSYVFFFHITSFFLKPSKVISILFWSKFPTLFLFLIVPNKLHKIPKNRLRRKTDAKNTHRLMIFFPVILILEVKSLVLYLILLKIFLWWSIVLGGW